MKVLSSFLILFLCFTGCQRHEDVPKPNVLFIIIDDLNDYVAGYEGHPQTQTPNLSRFASSGVMFMNAHSPSPMCGPSRSSFLTGVYPHHSRNFFQDPWHKNPVLRNTRTIMEQFRENGYYTWGTGKIMHHLKRDTWTEFGNPADYGPSVYNGEEMIAHPDVPEPFRSLGWVDGSFGPLVDLKGYGDSLSWIMGNTRNGIQPLRYNDENDRDLTPDERNAKLATEKLRELANKKAPFFAAVGFLRPHTPLIVPKKFFDKFPIDRILLPEILANDDLDTYLKDFPDGGLHSNRLGKKMFQNIGEAYNDQELGLKKFIQAYLACIAAVDENVGQVLQALEENELDKNTIVVITSDHGFHMGEKDYLYKNSLWKESTRVPLIIRAPGVSKSGKVNRPVSLVDLYPTLLDLTGLPFETRKNENGHALDGHSLMALLEDPENGEWSGPDVALSLIHPDTTYRDDPTMQHYAIRTDQYRYILYNTGQEELYDLIEDPNEWHNLAMKRDQYEPVLKKMRTLMAKMTQPYQLRGLMHTK